MHERPQCYKTLFMFNSLEHEFIMLINIKMQTIVGILPFISMISISMINPHLRVGLYFLAFKFL